MHPYITYSLNLAIRIPKIALKTYMETEPQLCSSDDVRELVSEIISRYNLGKNVDVKYNSGSDIEHGFSSKTVSVVVTGEKETIHLFVKYIADWIHIAKISMDKLYANEIYFYNTIYPEYMKFLDERNIKDGFRNTAKCYGTLAKGMLALENLKERGFTPFDANIEMNDRHIELVLEAYAKFHAISFAFQHQKADLSQEFRKNLFSFFDDGAKKAGLDRAVRYAMGDFLRKLDPITDKNILDNSNIEDLISYITDGNKFSTEYSILTQGDCWYNNAMFLYEGENKENPTMAMLIDWQMIRFASPVYDLSYFLYPVAVEAVLNNLDFYLKIYHNELSKQIREMGSNPEILYPYKVFKEEWRKHSRFGFVMSFMTIRTKLSSIKDVHERLEEYFRRMKILAQHFVENNLL